MEKKIQGRAKGGVARAAKLTAERKKEISKNALAAKAELAKLPKATHGSAEHPLIIGDVEIPCYVLEDGTRVLSQRGVIGGLGMSRGSSGGIGGDRLASFLGTKGISPFINNELMMAINNPIRFVFPGGGRAAFGYHATLLADICDAVLRARQEGVLHAQQAHIAAKCEILVRGFARVGIIALVDEATGYQKDRARNALAQILEAFVAKEIQPYVRTFDPDYYEYMFKLRGLKYPPESENSRPQYRPQYFGKLTNDIVYRRLAPGVLNALKDEAKKAEKKGKLFQHLSAEFGRQELLKHLGGVVMLMKGSKDWQEFMFKLNDVAPRYGTTLPLDLDEPDA